MLLRSLAWIYAIVFILIGVLGFIPGATTADSLLLGIFQVGTMHNVVHLISGLLAAVAASSSPGLSNFYFKIFGILYGITAIAGFIQTDTVFGLMSVNLADNILHLVIALVALAAGFGLRSK